MVAEDAYIASLDRRVTATETDIREIKADHATGEQTVAVLHARLNNIEDAFKSFRTALYTCAASIVFAAAAVVLYGIPHS